jgi:hypothetical protein
MTIAIVVPVLFVVVVGLLLYKTNTVAVAMGQRLKHRDSYRHLYGHFPNQKRSLFTLFPHHRSAE